MPRGWTYSDHPDQNGPIIFRDGPHHMAISYEFEPPQQGLLNTEWTFGIEEAKAGSKPTFHIRQMLHLNIPIAAHRRKAQKTRFESSLRITGNKGHYFPLSLLLAPIGFPVVHHLDHKATINNLAADGHPVALSGVMLRRFARPLPK